MHGQKFADLGLEPLFHENRFIFRRKTPEEVIHPQVKHILIPPVFPKSRY